MRIIFQTSYGQSTIPVDMRTYSDKFFHKPAKSFALQLKHAGNELTQIIRKIKATEV